MTKFKMTLKKSAAVLAAAALTISGLTGIGGFEGIFKSKTEIVSAAYAKNTYNVDYGIYLDNEGLKKCFYDGLNFTYEPFSGDGISWDKDSNTLTLTNFDFTTSTYAGRGALYISVIDNGTAPDITIKLFGKNTLGIVSPNTIYATPLSISYSNLTIEGPGSLEIKGEHGEYKRTLISDKNITINNCDVSAEGNITVNTGKTISINNARVSADGGFKTFDDSYDTISYSPIVNGKSVDSSRAEANSYDGRFLSTQTRVLKKDEIIYLEAELTTPLANIAVENEENVGVPTADYDMPLSAKHVQKELGNKNYFTIEPKSLNDPFEASLITITDTNVGLNLTINNFTYPSIADFLTNIVLTSTDSEQVEMAKAWLNYASAAQTYFEYDADKPANRYLNKSDRQTTSRSDVIRALRSKGVTGIAQIDPERSKGYEYIGTTLMLRNNKPITIKNYYTIVGNTSYSDVDSIKIDGKSYYFLCSSGGSADAIGTTCSVYDYIYSTLRNSEEDEELVNLCCAIYDMDFYN